MAQTATKGREVFGQMLTLRTEVEQFVLAMGKSVLPPHAMTDEYNVTPDDLMRQGPFDSLRFMGNDG